MKDTEGSNINLEFGKDDNKLYLIKSMLKVKEEGELEKKAELRILIDCYDMPYLAYGSTNTEYYEMICAIEAENYGEFCA